MSWTARFQPYCQAHAGESAPLQAVANGSVMAAPLGSTLFLGQSATPGPGSAVLTYSAAFGSRPGADPPVESQAQLSSLVDSEPPWYVPRHGFSVLASPPFTPTIPKACPAGKERPHCGHEMSLPVVDAVAAAVWAGEVMATTNAAVARADRAKAGTSQVIGTPIRWHGGTWMSRGRSPNAFAPSSRSAQCVRIRGSMHAPPDLPTRRVADVERRCSHARATPGARDTEAAACTDGQVSERSRSGARARTSLRAKMPRKRTPQRKSATPSPL